MKLEVFVVQPDAPKIVPGRSERQWMDDFPSRFPYRCLPLVMANTTGWEILCPFGFTVEWNGGPLQDDVIVYPDDMTQHMKHFATSHFTRGIVTFHTGYLFRTPPGWAVWAQGAPNHVKDGITPLTGLVETDWLPFPFTMNWRLTRPGVVHFDKDEPFCFITLMEHKKLDEVTPEFKSLAEDPELMARFQAWSKNRDDFNKRLRELDPETVKSGWQKHYFRGEMPNNMGEAPPEHMNRRRLKAPEWKDGKKI